MQHAYCKPLATKQQSALQRWLPLPPRAEDENKAKEKQAIIYSRRQAGLNIDTHRHEVNYKCCADIFLTQAGFDMSQANGSWRREVDDSTPPPTRRIRKAACTSPYKSISLPTCVGLVYSTLLGCYVPRREAPRSICLEWRGEDFRRAVSIPG